jgi:hypothetical protein
MRPSTPYELQMPRVDHRLPGTTHEIVKLTYNGYNYADFYRILSVFMVLQRVSGMELGLTLRHLCCTTISLGPRRLNKLPLLEVRDVYNFRSK